MKKIVMTILVGLLSFMGLNLVVNADTPPETFKARDVILLPEYVPGVVSYYKPIDGGLEVFCEDEGYTYLTGLTYGLWEQVNDGYIYIFEHRPNTGDSKKDYYIQSVAVWWFKDYLNGNDANIPKDKKDYIFEHKDTDEVCKLIVELVEGAKKYKQSKGYIKFSKDEVTFTDEGDYYLSSKITIKSSVKKFDGIKFITASNESEIVNSTVKNGSGTFQIKVPKAYINVGEEVTIKLSASGTYGIKKMYDYYIEYNHVFSKPYQHVIYGKVFTEDVPVNDEITIKLVRDEKVRISKTDVTGDKEIPGASLVLTDESGKEVSSWISTDKPHYETLKPGVYTLTEKIAPKGYVLSTDSITFKLDNNGTIYENQNGVWVKVSYIKMVNELDKKSVRISKTDATGDKEIPGASLVLTDESGKEVSSWISTDKPHYETLKPGVYTLKETIAPKGYVLSTDSITFKLDENGLIYENQNGVWVKVSYIKMINEAENKSVRISKTDATGDKEIPGASLVLTDKDGKEVSSWVSTDKPHYEALKPGVYTLTETIAPKGYVLSTDSITFKLDENGTIYENQNGVWVKVTYIRMINEAKSSINISKLDGATNDYLSGANLVIKNLKGEVIAKWTTTNVSYYAALDEGEYVLSEESAPKGYVLNTDKVYFKVDAAGNLYIKDANGNYNVAGGIIFYNSPEIIVVPATGLSSTLTYIIGSLVLGFGAIMLYRNEKKC